MIITLQHVRTVPAWRDRVGFCAKGARYFFKVHQLDWQDFIKHGITEDKLLATGDALALKVIEWAHQQEKK